MTSLNRLAHARLIRPSRMSLVSVRRSVDEWRSTPTDQLPRIQRRSLHDSTTSCLQAAVPSRLNEVEKLHFRLPHRKDRVTLNDDLAKQLRSSFAHVREPTIVQELLWEAMEKPSDIMLRAHTGSGKSFGTLLALLNREKKFFEQLRRNDNDLGTETTNAIIIVPSRPLALQYMYWAEQLIPFDLRQHKDKIVQVTHETFDRTDGLKFAEGKPKPRIRIFTARALAQIIRCIQLDRDIWEKGDDLLGVKEMKTLVLDEADQMFSLPGRYVNLTAIWIDQPHTPHIVSAMNYIIERRRTISGGKPQETYWHEDYYRFFAKERGRKDMAFMLRGERIAELRERSRKNAQRRDFTAYETENSFLTKVESKTAGSPVQLIVLGASANSVLRHFLTARSGWLRIDRKKDRDENKEETAKWMDFTGMTDIHKCSSEVRRAATTEWQKEAKSSGPKQMPRELIHHCVVVDEPTYASYKQLQEKLDEPIVQNWRNLDMRLAKSSHRLEYHGKQIEGEIYDVRIVKARTPTTLDEKEASGGLDVPMLVCLAFLFASMAVRRGLLVLRDSESTLRVINILKHLGVRAVNTDEMNMDLSTLTARERKINEEQEEEPVLHVIKLSNSRGVDFAGGIDHVFILGFDAVKLASWYVHLAGRASRLNANSAAVDHTRPVGRVITLLRGIEYRLMRKNRKYLLRETDEENILPSTPFNVVYDRERKDDYITEEAFRKLGHHEKQDINRERKRLLEGRVKRISTTDEVRMAGVYQSLQVMTEDIHPLSVHPNAEYHLLEKRKREIRAGREIPQDATGDRQPKAGLDVEADVRREAEEKVQSEAGEDAEVDSGTADDQAQSRK